MASGIALFPREVLAGIAKGAYTEIVAIDAPSSAVAGSRVDVTIRIRNTWTDYVHVSAIGVWDSEERFIDWLDYWIPPGETHSFSGSFIMPDRDVTIHAYSYYEAEDGWYFDDEAARDVRLGEVVGWQVLDSRTLAVKSVPPVVGWRVLDSRTLAVKSVPPVVGWQVLDEKTVGLTAAPPAVAWELVYQHEYPRGKTYVGKAEECTATLTIPLPEQLFPNSWVIEKIADTFAEEVAKEGGEMLDIKIYEDATPTWETNYKIVATAHASPFPWAVVIPLILAIILVIAFIKLVIEFKEIDWGEVPPAIPWAILALAGGLGILGVGAAVALAVPRPKE